MTPETISQTKKIQSFSKYYAEKAKVKPKMYYVELQD